MCFTSFYGVGIFLSLLQRPVPKPRIRTIEFVRVFYLKLIETMLSESAKKKKGDNANWKRMQAVMRFCGCTSANRFAHYIGLSRPEVLYRVMRGQNGISEALADRIVRAVGYINIDWLLHGEGEMFEYFDLEQIERLLRVTKRA